MVKIVLGMLISLLLIGCAGSTDMNSLVPSGKNGKSAELEYGDVGIVSEFKFKDIMSGTYKDLSGTSGFISHSGTRTLDITTKIDKSWTISVRSEKKGYKIPIKLNIDIDIDKPYVATIKDGKKTIGAILLEVQDNVDKKGALLKTIGLGAVTNNNIRFKDSKAKILGVNYTIKSVYKDNKGEVSSNPIAYEVLKGKTTYGVVSVGKNAFGGRTMTIWLKDKQSKIQEQSVATILTIVGYSSLSL
jgi:hypothetical protein